MKIAGVDEVGVGCLAGPVISSAIIFNSSALDVVFKDSKKTTAKQSCLLYTSPSPRD